MLGLLLVTQVVFTTDSTFITVFGKNIGVCLLISGVVDALICASVATRDPVMDSMLAWQSTWSNFYEHMGMSMMREEEDEEEREREQDSTNL